MFPILKLPSVALQKILDIFGIQDLILLSLCSSRTYLIVKMTRSMTTGLKLCADCIHHTIRLPSMDESDILLGAVNYDHNWVNIKGYVKIRGRKVYIGEVPYRNRNGNTPHMATFWNNPIYGLQELMHYLRDLFRVDIHLIHFNRNSLWILDWIQKIQNGVQVVETEKDVPLSFREYEKVIKNCNAKELCLYAYPKKSYKYTGGLNDREHIHIFYGEWLTLENVLDINAPDIIVERSKLTYTDLNQLLKKWFAGGFSKLKYLSLGLGKTAWDPVIAVLHGLIFIGLNVETKPRKTYYRQYKWNHDFKDNKELQRCDGKTASIQVTPESFTLAVWPDSSA